MQSTKSRPELEIKETPGQHHTVSLLHPHDSSTYNCAYVGRILKDFSMNNSHFTSMQWGRDVVSNCIWLKRRHVAQSLYREAFKCRNTASNLQFNSELRGRYLFKQCRLLFRHISCLQAVYIDRFVDLLKKTKSEQHLDFSIRKTQ